ncbi:Protein of unknown function [Gryllus bimaculatus]|nr:Protein of unknown function [Gryllus bimaculatus]
MTARLLATYLALFAAQGVLQELKLFGVPNLAEVQCVSTFQVYTVFGAREGRVDCGRKQSRQFRLLEWQDECAFAVCGRHKPMSPQGTLCQRSLVDTRCGQEREKQMNM